MAFLSFFSWMNPWGRFLLHRVRPSLVPLTTARFLSFFMIAYQLKRVLLKMTFSRVSANKIFSGLGQESHGQLENINTGVVIV